MESSPSSSSLSVATSRSALYSEENEISSDESHTQARLPYSDDGENDVIDGNGRQTNIPLSLSGLRSSSCNDMASGLQQQRRTERSNRGQLLEAQFQQHFGQHRQSQSEGQEPEREVVMPATTTTMSQKSLFVLRPVHRYVDLVCIGLSVLAYLLETTMNAALAIFGIGVGVGLVLGDSFRAALPLLPSVQVPQQQQQSTDMANVTAAQAGNEVVDPRSVPNLLPAQ